MSYFRALAHLEEQLGQEGFEALIASANTGQVKAFCDALLAGRPRSAYSVAIDYSMSIEQMVSAGRYDWSDANIVSKNFPVDGTGIITTTPELVHLGRKASSGQALAHMEANYLRPGKIEELLAFGATYPEVQRQFPIICLGSSWVDRGGRRHAPFLSGYGSGRELRLGWCGSVWDGYCRFLAVRK